MSTYAVANAIEKVAKSIEHVAVAIQAGNQVQRDRLTYEQDEKNRAASEKPSPMPPDVDGGPQFDPQFRGSVGGLGIDR
jgi:hypothetical protein